MTAPAPSVIFVDDEEDVRRSNAQTLELAGYRPLPCDSAEAALRAIADVPPDVIVCDIKLPGMNGLEFLRAAREIDGDLAILMITGHGDVATAVQAMRDGAYDFIEKPYPTERFLSSIARAAEKRALVVENRRLKTELERQLKSELAIVGATPTIERLRTVLATVADTDADVLVVGETGTGKELVAQALHRLNRRRSGRFVALNCAALPETLFESEFLGHEAGAFTGALRARTGRVEQAHKGTLFLDEIESMSPATQAKLLRVLQERTIERLGSNEPIRVDMRVVAATKTDLRQLAAEGRFREDLFYRLNVVSIRIPPLRERREDIPLLFEHFVRRAAERFGREPPARPPGLLQRLMSHAWPGNVRELQHVADRFVIGLAEGPDAAPEAAATNARSTLPEQVDLFEKTLILSELAAHRGSVKDTIEALGVPRKTFYDKLRRHKVNPDDFR